MAKQVETATPSTSTKVPQTDAPGARNLFFVVDTFDTGNKSVGTRIVDLYHFGTRAWLSNHQWWALHHGHTVEVRPADPEEIGGYLSNGKQALAEKFNSTAKVATKAVAKAAA